MPTDMFDRRNRRRSQRQLAVKPIAVNGGVPYRGGLLYNLSTGGAAVKFAEGVPAEGKRMRVNEPVQLRFGPRVYFMANVVRVFDDDFAVSFDWKRQRPSRV